MNYKYFFVVLLACGSLHAMKRDRNIELGLRGAESTAVKEEESKEITLEQAQAWAIKNSWFSTVKPKKLIMCYLLAVNANNQEGIDHLNVLGVPAVIDAEIAKKSDYIFEKMATCVGLGMSRGVGYLREHGFDPEQRPSPWGNITSLGATKGTVVDCVRKGIGQYSLYGINLSPSTNFRALKAIAMGNFPLSEKNKQWIRRGDLDLPPIFTGVLTGNPRRIYAFSSGREVETFFNYLKEHALNVPESWTVEEIWKQWKLHEGVASIVSALVLLKNHPLPLKSSATWFMCDTDTEPEHMLELEDALHAKGFDKSDDPLSIVYNKLHTKPLYNDRRRALALHYLSKNFPAHGDTVIYQESREEVLPLWLAAEKLGDTEVYAAMVKQPKVAKQVAESIASLLVLAQKRDKELPAEFQHQLSLTAPACLQSDEEDKGKGEEAEGD